MPTESHHSLWLHRAKHKCMIAIPMKLYSQMPICKIYTFRIFCKPRWLVCVSQTAELRFFLQNPTDFTCNCVRERKQTASVVSTGKRSLPNVSMPLQESRLGQCKRWLKKKIFRKVWQNIDAWTHFKTSCSVFTPYLADSLPAVAAASCTKSSMKLLLAGPWVNPA